MQFSDVISAVTKVRQHFISVLTQYRGWPSPVLGEHTDEVLSDLGYSADDIAKLHAAKAV